MKMALISPINSHKLFFPGNPSLQLDFLKFSTNLRHQHCLWSPINISQRRRGPYPVVNAFEKNSEPGPPQDDETDDIGVKTALSILRFYKREISPLLPKSCRYVPTCSEYSMIAYKKYGFVKGTILTACRICRCNPLGGSGFDPPRWFDEPNPPQK